MKFWRTQLAIGCISTALLMFLASARGGSTTAAASGDLPTAEEVLKRVLERAAKEPENDAQFDAHYAYRRTKRTDTRDGDGKVVKTKDRVSTHDPFAEPASKPLPSAGKAITEESLKQGEAKGRALERHEFVLDDQLLSRFRFEVKERDILENRPTLILDFTPTAKDVPVKNFKDRFINLAAGRVWVDEVDGTISKLELRLTGEVPVAGGLVGCVKKFNYGFQRLRTPQGWWYTRDVQWRLEGRQVLSQKRMDYEEHRLDVRQVK